MSAYSGIVPNCFHFVSGLQKQTKPLHLVFYLCLASCLRVNQPDAVYLYYHYPPFGRYWDLIKDRITPIWIPRVPFIVNYPYKQRAVKRYSYAHQSDFVRLEKLLAVGGVYADLDTIFVNPIPPGLYQQSFVLGREIDVLDPATRKMQPSLCNAFIMAERHAPFGRLWLDQMPAHFDGTWSRHSTLLPNKLAQAHPELVHIEPQHTFYKHIWSREGLHTLLEGCDRDYEGVVSMHLWAHLWWSRWRRDFSSFHAGRLTEEYIRHVDTTYNLVARKFLPPC